MWNVWSVDPLAEVGVESAASRLKRGEPGAVEAVLSRYQNRLFRYLLRLVGEPALAEDLFQQTWLNVLTRIRRYDSSRPFEPWLFTVARNLAIDHLRKTAPQSLDEERAKEPLARQASAYDHVLARERRKALADQLACLPLIYREALSLRFEEEMAFEGMAEVLGCPLSTAKSRVRRGLELLRLRMERRAEELQ